MSKATPGPWSATNEPGGGHPGNWFVVGDAGLQGSGRYVVQGGLNEPNAHLIAAAPDLLAALELVADRCPMCAAGEECLDDDCYVVRRALARARGEGGEQP